MGKRKKLIGLSIYARCKFVVPRSFSTTLPMGNFATSTAWPTSVKERAQFAYELPVDAFEHVARFLMHPSLFVRPLDVLRLLKAPEPLRAAVLKNVRAISTDINFTRGQLASETWPVLIANEGELRELQVAGVCSALHQLSV